LLVTIDGIDGCGKSTVAFKLWEKLNAKGHDCVLTKPLGGDKTGFAMRDLLLDPDMSLETDAQPFIALADIVHTAKALVIPALAEGNLVILDRYIPSTWVYQIDTADHLTIPQKKVLIEALQLWVPIPDLTVIIDVTVEEALTRVAKVRPEYGVPDVFESADVIEWTRRRLSYLSFTDCPVGEKGEVYTVSSMDVSADEIANTILRSL